MSIVLDGTTGITTPGLTNTGTETLVNLTTTGNTTLGDASTDTLNVGNGGLVKDASGNVGIGVTPSAWDSSRRALQLNSGSVFNTTAGDTIGVIQNGYNDGTGWKRVAAGYASRHYQNNGAHYFDIAGTSTAGSAISFTQAMTLDASGRLLVGVTSPTQSSTERFEVSGGMSLFIYNDDSVAPVYIRNNSTTASTIQPYTYFTDASSGNRAGFGVKYTDSSFHHYAQGGINWYTGAAGFSNQRMTLDSSGNVLVTGAGGLGYGTGSGGTVTQATSKSTAVTLNKPTGQITMNNAALAAGASVTFTLNNSLVAATDMLLVNVSNGTSYTAQNYSVGSGVAQIRVTNITGGSLSEAAVLNFAIIKGVTS